MNAFYDHEKNRRLLYAHQGVIQNIQSFNAKNNMKISTGSHRLITTEVAKTPC